MGNWTMRLFIFGLVLLALANFGIAASPFTANVQTPSANPLYVFPSPIETACANTLGGACAGTDVLIGTNMLTSTLTVTGNIIIASTAAITSNGYSFLATNVFNNKGVIYTGTLNNGANVASCTTVGITGGNILTSWAGSGGGGGGTGGTPDYAGGIGGSTLAAGGTAGSATGGDGTGGNGALPSPPTINNANIITWYSNGFYKYISGAGGGSGACGSGTGGSGGSGAYGIYIQANSVTAGIINANGIWGQPTSSVGSGGGGGGGLIIISYNSVYSAGTYNVVGGPGGVSTGGETGFGNGGAGSNGNTMAYQYITPPIIYYSPVVYPYNIYTHDTNPSNTYSLYYLANLIQANVVNIGYIPPAYQPTASYTYNILQFNRTGTANVLAVNLSVSMTDIVNALTINTPAIQYYPNTANFSKGSFASLPTSWKLWSYPAASQPAAYGINTIQGSVFASNSQTFPVNVQLTYPSPFGSFNISLQNNPAVQASITQNSFIFYPSNTGSGTNIYTRELLNATVYNQSTLTSIFGTTNLYEAWNLNNYSAANTMAMVSNNFQVYIGNSNYLNPPLTSTLLTTITTNSSFLQGLNNFCPTTVASNYANIGAYIISSGQGAQYTTDISSGFSAPASGDYLQILEGASRSSATKVQQVLITTTSFTVPLIVGGIYGFTVVNSGCSSIYATNFSTWTSPIYITLPISTGNVTLLYPKPQIRCTMAFNSMLGNNVMTCIANDSTNQIDSWTLKLFNESSFSLPQIASNTQTGNTFAYTNSSLSNVIVYQAIVSWLTSNGITGSKTFTFNISFTTGLDTATDGLFMAIIMLVCVGFGVGLAYQPGGSQHAISNTLFIMAFGIFLCYMIGLSTGFGFILNSALIVFLVFIGALSMHYENKGPYGGY